jgi:hypothetical protein
VRWSQAFWLTPISMAIQSFQVIVSIMALAMLGCMMVPT